MKKIPLKAKVKFFKTVVRRRWMNLSVKNEGMKNEEIQMKLVETNTVKRVM